MTVSLRPFLTLLCLTLSLSALRAQDGFARDVTGGNGGTVHVARTAEEFREFATGSSAEKRIVMVEGTIKIGEVMVSSNRSFVGKDRNATLIGTIYIRSGINNIIVQNLNITNPSAKDRADDGITIRGGRNVFITHCTFYDCADGCIDVSEESDNITVSWSKFYYTEQNKHRFTMLTMGPEKSKKKLRVTLHHNWWAERCGSRMPAARQAKVHMYNNYFNCADNDYCTNARGDTELLSENNYYDGVRNPFYGEENSKIKSVDNVFKNCSGKLEDDRDDSVFKPPYSYKLDPVQDVPAIVRARAGVQ